MAITHDSVWSAIDLLADKQGLSTAALAKKAGLDPTSLNPSKRRSQGRERWPSTETIAKLLDASSATIDDLLILNGCERETLWSWLKHIDQSIPMIGAWEPADRRDNDDAFVKEILLKIPPHLMGDADAYVFRVEGPSLQPFYDDDSLIIASQSGPPTPGDRIVIKAKGRAVAAMQLLAHMADGLDVSELGGSGTATRLKTDEVQLVARIVWVSQ